MGTTVTTNLSLIKPDEVESIKEALPTFPGWHDQNADNCDKLDGLFRKSTHTYSPTWTADTTNPTLGSGGFVEGKYFRIHPCMVFGFIRLFTGGAGFATGSGFYRFSIPTTLHTEFAGLNVVSAIGKAYLHDDSAVATSTNLVAIYEEATNLISFRKHDGNFWRDNTPFTLAQQDRLSCYFMLPTVSA